MVQEALHANWQPKAVLVLKERTEELKVIYNQVDPSICFELDETAFRSLSTHTQSEGIIGILPFPDLNFGAIQQELVLPPGPGFILDRIQDPGNLGTIIRIADWFGCREIIASLGTVDITNPKVLRSSMGSIFRINYHLVKHIPRLLAANVEKVWVADMEGRSLREVSIPNHSYIVLGNEANGIGKEIKAIKGIKFVTIPQNSDTESLNVSVAAGIFAWELRK